MRAEDTPSGTLFNTPLCRVLIYSNLPGDEMIQVSPGQKSDNIFAKYFKLQIRPY
jgi:hypothetical protein